MKRSLTWTFRITLEKTPQGDRERTWIDLLLFDQLVRNIISQHVVDHWMIHRRWMDRKHAFAFWCYGEDCLGQNGLRNRINLYVESDLTVKALKRAGYIEAIDTPVEQFATAMDDHLPSGDSHWDEEVQQCYPQFIQRPCETLRDLIDAIQKKIGPAPNITDGKNLPEVQGYYCKLEEAIRQLWFKNAGHAYFHFFHEVFGYQPFLAVLGIRQAGDQCEAPQPKQEGWLVPPCTKWFVIGDIR